MSDEVVLLVTPQHGKAREVRVDADEWSAFERAPHLTSVLDRISLRDGERIRVLHGSRTPRNGSIVRAN